MKESIERANVPQSPKKKIGLLTSIGETLDAFFVEIVEEWRLLGFEVSVAAGTRPQKFDKCTVIAGLTRNPSLRNLRALNALRRWVKQEQIDVVVTNTATASMLARIGNIGAQVVYFCHGLHWEKLSFKTVPYRVIERGLLSNTSKVVCLNSSDDEWFRERAPTLPRLRLKFGVGLDTERFARRPRRLWQRDDVLQVVWCGEFSARKNPWAAVQVAQELQSRGIRFKLKMIGQGDAWDQIRSQVEAFDSIELVGRTDPVPHFELAHVLLQTASWEGLPRVALEATAMGMPTVGFDVKGVRDIPGARVVPQGDTSGLANVVMEAAALGSEELPVLNEMSYRHAARKILRFLDARDASHE